MAKHVQRVLPANADLVPVDADRVFEGVLFDVYHWQQELFDGSIQTFEMLKRSDTVVVLPVVNDEVWLIEEEQPGIASSLVLPGGRVDANLDDSIEDAARRELLEETGLACRDLRLLDVLSGNLMRRKLEHYVYFFLAETLVSTQEPCLDAGEQSEIVKIPIESFWHEKQRLPQADQRFFSKYATLVEMLQAEPYDGELDQDIRAKIEHPDFITTKE